VFLLGTRSLNGCRTCRLRRKKCDELRPRCARCERLGVGCLEYGSKPEYMDGGLEERKKVEEIKNAIKAAKVYNRLLHHSDTGSTAQCNVYETHDSGIVQQLQSEKSALDNRCFWNSNYSSETDPIQHIQPDGINQSTKTITEPDYGQNSFDCDEGLSSLYMVFEGDLSLNAYTPSLQTTNLSPTETQPECSFDNVLDLTPLPSTPILSPSKDDFEFEKAVLLIRYMDNVLYIQFPFYNDALSHHGRGWVLSLITTVKPICTFIFAIKNSQFCLVGYLLTSNLNSSDYTALALSSYHRDAENCQGNKTKRYELYWENYTRAIIKLRQYIISASDSDAVAYAFKVSFCILQLIFCEVIFRDTFIKENILIRI
jgi:hypothetical protein